jgi:hypothetical protein
MSREMGRKKENEGGNIRKKNKSHGSKEAKRFLYRDVADGLGAECLPLGNILRRGHRQIDWILFPEIVNHAPSLQVHQTAGFVANGRQNVEACLHAARRSK